MTRRQKIVNSNPTVDFELWMNTPGKNYRILDFERQNFNMRMYRLTGRLLDTANMDVVYGWLSAMQIPRDAVHVEWHYRNTKKFGAQFAICRSCPEYVQPNLWLDCNVYVKITLRTYPNMHIAENQKIIQS